MISATSLNAQSALNKGPQIPMVGLDNGRMRIDSQKFLVPSLPVSARAVGNHHNSSDPKRRERSIVNGTAHPPQSDNHYSQHHHNLSHNYPSHNINGLRTSSYVQHGGGGGSISPRNNINNNSHRTSPHHPYSHLNNSPRKDAHSPMYARSPGELPGLSPGGGGSYQARSSMPIPCSSPAQGSSASPKGSHSHSPSSGTPNGGNYSPKLPSGPAMLPPSPGASDLSSLAAAGRLYSGFPPPHPSVAAHLSPAFYAAAAAAAVSHSIPYPIFGAHYSPHSHSAAAASAYLDSFHSALVNRGPPLPGERQRSRSPSPPPSRAHGSFHHGQSQHHHEQSQHQHEQSHNHHGSSQSTSVTSLHSKLIESTIISSDGQTFNGHHNHVRSSPNANDRFSPGSLGISQGGPLGISGGIMGIGHGLNLQSSRMKNGSSPQKGLQGENLTVNKSANLNGFNVSSKQWMEHPGLNGNGSVELMNRKYAAEIEAREVRDTKNFYKESPTKHRILTHSPDNQSGPSQSQKISKSISFASDTYPPNNGYRISNFPQPPNSYSHINGHQPIPLSSNPGILTDSNYSKRQINNQQITNSHQHNQQTQEFHPPSPKKRAAHWNFAVPASPTSKLDLPPPPQPAPVPSMNLSLQPSHTTVHEPSKYLNSNPNQNHKPSNQHHPLSVPTGSTNNTMYLSPGQSAQHLYPSSPRQPGSGPSTPKSPSVHQVKFSFSSGNSKENINGVRNGSTTGRTDSSSSTSSNEGNVPWPVELEAFRRGSLIKLASGDLKPVEDLRAEDFIHAAANMADFLRIIHCTVMSIQSDGSTNGTSVRKVTLAVGSHLQNQQVVVPSTPEQPFFVLGRGWSSLSPKTTEKLLQLSCSTLAVGDVCITLSKSSSKIQSQNSSRSQSQVPKSPSVKSKGNGSKSRNSSTTANTNKSVNTANPNLKRSQQALAASSTSSNNSCTTKWSQEGRKTVDNDNHQIGKSPVSNCQTGTANLQPKSPITKNCMGPPLSTIFTKPSNPQLDRKMIEASRPPSPKRRRWSAPEPETIAEHENEWSIKGKNSTPPPSGLASRDNDQSGSDKNKADVNSNVEFRNSDAQSVKA